MSIRANDKPDDRRPHYSGRTVKQARADGNCMVWVNDVTPGAGHHWCSRKAKPGTSFCGVHSDEAEAKRRAKQDEYYKSVRERSEIERHRYHRETARMEAFDILFDALREIAAKFEVAQSTISDIINGVTSAWVRNES